MASNEGWRAVINNLLNRIPVNERDQREYGKKLNDTDHKLHSKDNNNGMPLQNERSLNVNQFIAGGVGLLTVSTLVGLRIGLRRNAASANVENVQYTKVQDSEGGFMRSTAGVRRNAYFLGLRALGLGTLACGVFSAVIIGGAKYGLGLHSAQDVYDLMNPSVVRVTSKGRQIFTNEAAETAPSRKETAEEQEIVNAVETFVTDLLYPESDKEKKDSSS